MRVSFLKIVIVLTFLTGSFIVLSPVTVFAAEDYGLKATAGAAGLPTNKTIPQLTGQIIGAGLSMLGIVFLGLMLYGGFNWMIARGDPKTVIVAKDTIINAVIGFAIVAAAYAITDFAIGAITSGTSSGGGGGGAAPSAYDLEVENCERNNVGNDADIGTCISGINVGG